MKLSKAKLIVDVAECLWIAHGIDETAKALTALCTMKCAAMEQKDYAQFDFMTEVERTYVNIARRNGCFGRAVDVEC